MSGVWGLGRTEKKARKKPLCPERGILRVRRKSLTLGARNLPDETTWDLRAYTAAYTRIVSQTDAAFGCLHAGKTEKENSDDKRAIKKRCESGVREASLCSTRSGGVSYSAVAGSVGFSSSTSPMLAVTSLPGF